MLLYWKLLASKIDAAKQRKIQKYEDDLLRIFGRKV
jgi:hypothetical protein